MGPEGGGGREKGGCPREFPLCKTFHLCCRLSPRKRPLTMSSSLYMAQSLDLHYTSILCAGQARPIFQALGQQMALQMTVQHELQATELPCPLLPPSHNAIHSRPCGKTDCGEVDSSCSHHRLLFPKSCMGPSQFGLLLPFY